MNFEYLVYLCFSVFPCGIVNMLPKLFNPWCEDMDILQTTAL